MSDLKKKKKNNKELNLVYDQEGLLKEVMFRLRTEGQIEKESCGERKVQVEVKACGKAQG